MWVTTVTAGPKEAIMTHADAPLTSEGWRRPACLVVEEGWPLRRAAEHYQ